jgi:HPt (histidine-containing phosphotransfer) domain-containing protein
MQWIDEEILAQLGRDAGEELLPQLVAIFVEDGQKNLDALVGAVRTRDAEHLLLLAHTLKSVCATYGAMCCHAEALALENSCRQQKWTAMEQGVADLQISLPASCSALLALVPVVHPA